MNEYIKPERFWKRMKLTTAPAPWCFPAECPLWGWEGVLPGPGTISRAPRQQGSLFRRLIQLEPLSKRVREGGVQAGAHKQSSEREQPKVLLCRVQLCSRFGGLKGWGGTLAWSPRAVDAHCLPWLKCKEKIRIHQLIRPSFFWILMNSAVMGRAGEENGLLRCFFKRTIFSVARLVLAFSFTWHSVLPKLRGLGSSFDPLTHFSSWFTSHA